MPHDAIPGHARASAKRMRKAMTGAGRAFWYAVRAHRLNGLGFRRQYPVAGYILDFACPECRLAVEIDGPAHELEENRIKDATRTAVLREAGWRVLRFPDRMIVADMIQVRKTKLSATARQGGDNAD